MSFTKVHEFLPKEDADNILKFLATVPYNTSNTRGVARYGKMLSYSSGKVSDQIPEIIEKLIISKLQSKGFVEEVGHVTINRYLADEIIPYHIDNKEAGDIITIMSFGGSCTMLFKDSRNRLEYPVEHNSLVQFMDCLRWKYKHSVSGIKDTRYSIVFRKN